MRRLLGGLVFALVALLLSASPAAATVATTGHLRDATDGSPISGALFLRQDCTSLRYVQGVDTTGDFNLLLSSAETLYVDFQGNGAFSAHRWYNGQPGGAASCADAVPFTFDGSPFTFTIARPTFPLDGSITDQDTGAPIAGASVILHAGPFNNLQFSNTYETSTIQTAVSTDADGNYHFDLWGQTYYWIEVQAGAGYVAPSFYGGNYTPGGSRITGGQERADIAVPITGSSSHPHHGILGTLTMPSLSPLQPTQGADQTLELRLYRADHCCTVVATTYSQPNSGFYSFPSVPDGDYKLQFVPYGNGGFRGEWYSGHAADFTSAETIHLAGADLVVDQLLIAENDLYGTTTKISGGSQVPFAGVTVIAYDATQQCCVEVARTTSDAMGVFRLPVPRGWYKVFYRSPDQAHYGDQWYFVRASFDLAQSLDLRAAGDFNVSTQFSGGPRFAGRVTRSDTGDGVGGVQILVRYENGNENNQWGTTTAADGSYILPVIFVEGGTNYSFSLTPPPGLVPLFRRPVAMTSDPTTVDFVLDAGYPVSGRVTDATSGAGLPNFVVTFQGDCIGNGLGALPVATDATGRYTVTVQHAGQYLVKFSANGPYVPTTWHGAGPAGTADCAQATRVDVTTTTTLDQQIARFTYPLDGSVTSQDTGLPIDGATVTLHAGPFNDTAFANTFATSHVEATATTDADGNYHFDVWPNTYYWIEVDGGAGYVAPVYAWYLSPYSATFPGGQTLTGGAQLRADVAVPISGASTNPHHTLGGVLLMPSQSPFSPTQGADQSLEVRLYRADHCCTVIATTYSTAVSGFFDFGSLPDGDYRLRVLPTGNKGFRGEWYADHAEDFASATVIHLTQNTTISQVLIAENAIYGVTTKIASLLEETYGGVTVIAYDATKPCCVEVGRTTSAADGSYRLVLPRGWYKVLYRSPDPAQYGEMWWSFRASFDFANAIDLRPAGDYGANVRFYGGPRFTGTVTDRATSAGIGGVHITVRYENGNENNQWGTTTAADGTYTVPVQFVGDGSKYSFTLDPPPGYLGPYRNNVQLSTDPTVVDFQLDRGVTVTGRVTDATSGAGLGLTTVWFQSDCLGNGLGSVPVGTDPDGYYEATIFPSGTYIVRFDVSGPYVPTTYRTDSADGTTDCAQAVPVDIGSDMTIDQRVERLSVPLDGTITSQETGLPVPGATVLLHAGPFNDPSFSNTYATSTVVATATAGADGNYHFAVWPNTYYWIEVDGGAGYIAPAWAWLGQSPYGTTTVVGGTQLIGGFQDRVDIAIPIDGPSTHPHHSIFGQLTMPVTHDPFVTSTGADESLAVRLYRADQCCSVVATTYSHPVTGTYDFGPIPDGDYKMQFVPQGHGGFRGEWYSGHAADFASAQTIHLSGASLQIDQQLIAENTLRGRTMKLDTIQTPFAGVTVIVYDAQSPCCVELARTTTDADGRYAVRIPRAWVKVLYRSPDPAHYGDQWYFVRASFDLAELIDLRPAGDFTANISFYSGPRFSGRVTRQGTAIGVGGAAVLIRYENGNENNQWGTTTAADGSYILPVLFVEDGTRYSISISPSGTCAGAFRSPVALTTDPTVVDFQVDCGNTPPTADAGGALDVDEGGSVTLDGSGSSDPDGDALTYQWTLVPDGAQTAALADATTAHPRFDTTDDGVYTFQLTVTDPSGATDSATTIVVVHNVAPTVAALAPATTDEGTAYGTAGSFADPGADTWTGSVDYGDGSGVQPLAISGTTFALGHTYGAAGAYTVTATVCDDDGDCGSAEQSVTVRNVDPRVTLPAAGSSDEGSPFTDGGSFQDPGQGDAFTATVDWGDGSSEPLALTAARTFALAHTYADDGAYLVTVVVHDAAGGTGSATENVTVRNVAPQVAALADATADEGSPYAAPGSFSDPGADGWSATVDYGDGTGSQPLALSGKTFTLGHTYMDDGAYTVTIHVRDDDGGLGSATQRVVVRNVAPTADAGGPRSGPWGAPIAFAGTGHDAGADTLTFRWAFGDGTFADGPNTNHAYASPGTYTARLTVTDGDGGSATADSSVTVGARSAALTCTGGLVAFGGSFTATFTDTVDVQTAQLAGRLIVFDVNGTTQTGTTAADGRATASFALVAATYDLRVSFAGDALYLPATGSCSVTMGSTSGKATGGATAGGVTASFEVRSDGESRGNATFKVGGATLRARAIDSYGQTADATKAYIGGVLVDGRRFLLIVEDHGEPSTGDTLQLFIDGVAQNSDVAVRSGNIQIH